MVSQDFEVLHHSWAHSHQTPNRCRYLLHFRKRISPYSFVACALHVPQRLIPSLPLGIRFDTVLPGCCCGCCCPPNPDGIPRKGCDTVPRMMTVSQRSRTRQAQSQSRTGDPIYPSQKSGTATNGGMDGRTACTVMGTRGPRGGVERRRCAWEAGTTGDAQG